MSSRSHALRGNVFQDALRPFPLQWLYIDGRRASKVHSHAERGNEGNRANQKSVNYFTAFLKDAGNCLAGVPIMLLGTNEQKENNWIPLCERSKARFTAFCLTEPEAG